MTAPAADPFEPEKLTAYEIGVKSDVTRALRVDASVFYYRYKDQQILGKVFDDASQSFIGRFVNANSRISGGEVDLEWRPLAGISISQYAGFAEGYYTSKLLNAPLNPALPPVDYDGRPESFPKWSYGGDVELLVGSSAPSADRRIELQFSRHLQPVLPARQQRFHHSEILAGECESVLGAGLRRALDGDLVGPKYFR